MSAERLRGRMVVSRRRRLRWRAGQRSTGSLEGFQTQLLQLRMVLIALVTTSDPSDSTYFRLSRGSVNDWSSSASRFTAKMAQASVKPGKIIVHGAISI
jgi:hypothetical protein